MFDRTLLAGYAEQAILAVMTRGGTQPAVPYDFVDEDGVVTPVMGIWQALDVENEEPEGSDAARWGNTRYVIKTDPFDPKQPAVGSTFSADGRIWTVVEEGSQEGLFVVWPIMKG